MNNTWRVTDTGYNPAYVNMAIDEYLLDIHIKENTLPVLRIYNWTNPTLSIGRNQNINEINTDFCKKHGIDIVRRATGGKAVFHNKGITYSFISCKKYGTGDSLIDSYKEISMAIIKGLNKVDSKINLEFGKDITNSYFKNPNCFATSTKSDLSYMGNKLIGSAQLRKGDSFLQHGEILIEQDFDIYNYLFSDKTFIDNQICIKNIIGYVPNPEKIKDSLKMGFEEHFNIKLEKTELNKSETELSVKYYQKYKTD